MENGVIDTEIMNFKQIQAAWNQGAMKGNSPAHKNFADQMSIKTAINRACKLIIRTSDDAVLFDNDEEEKADVVSSNVKAKIETEANKKSLSISEEEVYTQHEVIDESPKTKEVQTEKSGELAEKEKAEISKEESDLFNSTKQNTKPNF
jgi:recombination protein RecT